VRRRGPIGVLLAGGDARHLGGDAGTISLGGRSLAHHPLQALIAELDDVVVACRLDTVLPPLPGVAEAWVEPDGPRGPVGAIVSALREARGRSVIALAMTLPLVDARIIATLRDAPAGPAAVVPRLGERLEPLVARWDPGALPLLAGMHPSTDLATAVLTVRPSTIAFDPDDARFLRMRAAEDLLRAAAELDHRGRALA
jgi:molybdopterin-guanine dinucleotide biosynthesis protein A